MAAGAGRNVPFSEWKPLIPGDDYCVILSRRRILSLIMHEVCYWWSGYQISSGRVSCVTRLRDYGIFLQCAGARNCQNVVAACTEQDTLVRGI